MPQEEWLALKQLFGDGGLGWLQVALAACLFLALIFRPERIRSQALFKLACWLFAFSIMVPPVFNIGLTLFASVTKGSWPPSPGASWSPVGPFLLSLERATGPVLFGLSLLCGLLSLVPGPYRENRLQPTRHPLD